MASVPLYDRAIFKGTNLACVLSIVFLFALISPVMAASAQPSVAPRASLLGQEAARLAQAGRFPEAIEKEREAVALLEQVLGPDHLLVASHLATLASLLNMTGETAAARPLIERSLKIKEAKLGPEDRSLASDLHTLGFILLASEEYAEARKALERALQIQERVHGADSSEVVFSLRALALLHIRTRNYETAKDLYGRSLQVREKALGTAQRNFAESLSDLAALHEQMGNYGDAKSAYERVLGIREQTLGPSHPDVAVSLSKIADVLAKTGDYAGAKAHYERALKIREQALGPTHYEVAVNLGDLAEVLRNLGEFTAARPMLERAVRTYERSLGPTHPLVASAWYHLGLFLETIGDHPMAKAAYDRSLAIREQTRGPMHPDVATSLSSLGLFFLRTGDPASGKVPLERALSIREKTLGVNHPDTASSLFELAEMFRATGEYDPAKRLYERALSIQEQTLGPKDPIVASTLHGLAELHHSRGENATAKLLVERAISILELSVGINHPRMARELQALAPLLEATGDAEGATAANLRALRILEQTLGENSLETAQAWGIVAYGDWKSGRYAEASANLARAIAGAESNIQRGMVGLGVRQKLAFLERIYPLVAELFSMPPAYVSDEVAYRALANWKNLAFRTLVEERVAVESSSSPAVRALVQEYTSIRQNLAVAYSISADPARLESQRARIEGRITRLEELEGELSRLSADFRLERTLRIAGPTEVCAALPGSGALVELFRFDRRDLKAKTQAPWYLAFVLQGGDCATPIRVDLGPAAPIDDEVRRFREALSREAPDPAARALRAEYRQRVAARLQEKLFPPALQTAIAGKPRLLIAPDGALALLPFGLLPGEDGHEFLLETRTIGYVPSGRDLLRRASPSAAASGLLAVGAPAFDRVPAQSTQVAQVRAGCGAVDEPFAPLPGTAAELQAIRTVYQQARPTSPATVLEGAQATKAALLERAATARILHLATHAYFAEETCTPAGLPVLPPEGTLRDVPTFLGHNPLLLAGVALAGANEREKGDGILTALEITALDLRNTDLVVLSACDTGLGTLARGQELLGLRWAFTYAGAKSLVTSLWTVPDAETAALMGHFYTALLGKGLSVADALRAAQLTMLEEALAKGDPAPHTWGAFVASGRSD
jgi:CHAT domain-containing protein/tetratricopeptide (TPR) repeat protein